MFNLILWGKPSRSDHSWLILLGYLALAFPAARAWKENAAIRRPTFSFLMLEKRVCQVRSDEDFFLKSLAVPKGKTESDHCRNGVFPMARGLEAPA